MQSEERDYKDVKELAEKHKHERIDIRPYMIHQPFVCLTTDKIQKVLDIYRFFQVRQLCVVNPVDGSLQGVISREDIFSYMSL
jgi:CBS domain-containing protein